MVNEPGIAADRLAILAASILRQVRRLLGRGAGCRRGQPTALGIGALMNSRGLMELIIINIGLQKRRHRPGLFSMMVLMAIVTTLMATPLFKWVTRDRRPAAGVEAPA